MNPLVLLVGLMVLSKQGAASKHGAELTASKKTVKHLTLRKYADGFIRLTSTDVDFYLPPGKRTAADAVERTRGTSPQIAHAIKFAAENFE